MRYFLLPLLFAASFAHAEMSVHIHGLSNHTGTKTYNEVNTGLSVSYRSSSDLSYQVGFYKNSYNRQTVFGAVNYTPFHVGPVSFGGFAGVGTGYDMPALGGALATIDTGRVTLLFRVIPKVGDMDGVTALELGFKF